MTNLLNPNESLDAGNSLVSQDGRFTFTMQGDGNLVLYMAGAATWASNTMGSNATRVIMQGDGNLVIYGANDNVVWASNTPGNPGAYLEIQNDGNIVIYGPNGNALWATNTSIVTASRMRIRIESILCYDPEDLTSGDQFYMTGLSVIDDGSPNPKTQAIIVPPIDMRSGYTRYPSPAEANVFDDAVTAGSVVRLVLRAFDEDVAKDWERRPQWIDTITQSSATTIAAAVATGVTAATWPVVIGGAIALGLLAGIYFGIKYDKDDELGNLYLAIPTTGLSNEDHIWQFSRQDWIGWSSWNYIVRLRIERM